MFVFIRKITWKLYYIITCNIGRNTRITLLTRERQKHQNDFAIMEPHFCTCIANQKVLGKRLKVLTPRKFFGVYYHSAMIHAHRSIVSGHNVNTEHEEAILRDIKKFANKTSNHQSENNF